MAETLYCILNIEWAWKRNHSKDSRQVSPITDSQTVQAQACIDRLGHENNRKLCLRNTALLLVCAGLLCDKSQVLCFLFSEVFCIKGSCFMFFLKFLSCQRSV